ncbi:MAG: hypothetical protein WC358_09640 [Ignavibacteria bacterium]|jgi:hypothetical protein
MEYSDNDAANLAEALKAMGEVKISSSAYNQAFWDKLEGEFRKSNERYESECRAMCIDPLSGKSTMTHEQMNRMFNF